MLIDIIGWAGAILILAAYYLVSTKKVLGSSALYQALNLIGAVSLVINAYVKGAIPPAALNAVWAIIAVVSLFKTFRRK